jgi:DNA-binding response OmpR family regulator
MVTGMVTVVVADHDPQMLRLEARNLQLEGYAVAEAHDGEEALERIAATQPNLVLLDVMLPKRDGFAVTQAVRMFSWVPIILVAERGVDHDKIRGFDLGVDDFLTKPFSVDELLARVRAVLRRTHLGGVEDPVWGTGRVTVGELEIELLHHRVALAGREIHLTAIEYRLLAELAANAGRTVIRERLLDVSGGYSIEVSTTCCRSVSTGCGRRSSQTWASRATWRRNWASATC